MVKTPKAPKAIRMVDLTTEQVNAIVKELQKMVLNLVKGDRGRIKIKREILNLMANDALFSRDGGSISLNHRVTISVEAVELIFMRLDNEKKKKTLKQKRKRRAVKT